MADKASHAEVRYREGTSLRKCMLCTMFRKSYVDARSHCTAVVDPIRMTDLCDLFERKGEGR